MHHQFRAGHNCLWSSDVALVCHRGNIRIDSNRSRGRAWLHPRSWRTFLKPRWSVCVCVKVTREKMRSLMNISCAATQTEEIKPSPLSLPCWNAVKSKRAVYVNSQWKKKMKRRHSLNSCTLPGKKKNPYQIISLICTDSICAHTNSPKTGTVACQRAVLLSLRADSEGFLGFLSGDQLKTCVGRGVRGHNKVWGGLMDLLI